MANFPQSTLNYPMINGHVAYDMRTDLYMSQVDAYYRNQHLNEVLQQHLQFSRQQDPILRSGNHYASHQVQENVNNNSSLLKLSDLRQNHSPNELFMLPPQIADAIQTQRSKEVNFSTGGHPYASFRDTPSLSRRSHSGNHRSELHGLDVHHSRPNPAESLMHYNVHRRRKEHINLKRNATRSVGELQANQFCNPAGRECFAALYKRPRLSQGTSPLPLYVQNHDVDNSYSLGAIWANASPEAVNNKSDMLGHISSRLPNGQCHTVSTQLPSSHLSMSNIHSQDVNKVRQLGTRNASIEQQRISLSTIQNGHPLGRHACRRLRKRSQQFPVGESTTYPREFSITHVTPPQHSATQSSAGFAVPQRRHCHAPNDIATKVRTAGKNRKVTTGSASANDKRKTIHYNEDNILFRALTSNKHGKHNITPVASKRNVSRYGTNSNSLAGNLIAGFQSKPQIRWNSANEEVTDLTGRTLPHMSRNIAMRSATISPNSSQKERKPNQYQTVKSWNSNHENHDVALKAPSSVACKTFDGPKTDHLAKKRCEKSQVTNFRYMDHEDTETQKRCISYSGNTTTDTLSRESFKSHNQGHNSRKIHQSTENSNQVLNLKQAQPERDYFLKDKLESREGLTMSYGTFLQEVIVPMTLAMSPQKHNRRASLGSILDVWQKQKQKFSFVEKSDGDVYFRKVGKDVETPSVECQKGIKAHTVKASQSHDPKNSTAKCNGKDHNRTGSDTIKEEYNIVSKMADSCTINLEEHVDGINLLKLDVNNSGKGGVENTTPTSPKQEIEPLSEFACAPNDRTVTRTITEEEDTELAALKTRHLKRKSARVVLKASDHIKMKICNAGSQSYTSDGSRYHKRRKQNEDCPKEKKILMRIGSERLFTRSYHSTISSKKSHPKNLNRKQQRTRHELLSAPKEFTRIALSVHKTSGETILHRIVRLNSKNSLRYCLDSGFHDDVNKKDNAGYTPLHECCVFGRLWIAEQLILCGADVNVSSYDGTRPLHDAVENGYTNLVRLLLANGADPLIPTYAKRTALDNAKSLAMRKLLLDYLTDINGTSDDLKAKLKTASTRPSGIRFRSSYSSQEHSSWENTFLDTSSLDEGDKLGSNSPLLYLKEKQHPHHFRFQLKENERIKTWYYLFEVLSRLKIPAVTFPYLYPHIKVHGLPIDIFIKKVERARGQLQNDHLPEIYASKELIEFVEADDEMSAILQMEGWTC